MIKLLLVLILALSCQDYNSNSGDKFRYGPLGLEAGSSAEFTSAYVILLLRCASCHHHDAYAGYKSEQAWKDAGLVVGGNPDASTVINNIRNYEGTGSNMPQDSGPLPDEEYTALKTWVQSVTP
jgi:mono/diheme cytochrome c family protein